MREKANAVEHGKGASAEYEITDGHRESLPGNPTKGNYIQEGRRDGRETN